MIMTANEAFKLAESNGSKYGKVLVEIMEAITAAAKSGHMSTEYDNNTIVLSDRSLEAIDLYFTSLEYNVEVRHYPYGDPIYIDWYQPYSGSDYDWYGDNGNDW